MTIDELRKKIDEKDDALSGIFAERMALCKEIGKIKAEENRAINASERENEIIVRVAKNKPEELVKYVALFYRNVFSLSKAYQSEFYAENALIGKKISESVRKNVVSATIAARAEAEERAVALTAFPVAVVTEFGSDEGIIKAVKSGLCDFAILPCDEGDGFMAETLGKIIENDLSVVNVIDCERSSGGKTPKNAETAKTTEAAETAETAEIHKTAEIAELHETAKTAKAGKIGYAVLAATPTIFAGADRAAVVLEMKNAAGSLLLPASRLAGAGLNVTQIKTFAKDRLKTLVFIEFECDVTQTETLNVIAELSGSSEKFRFLGAYKHTL